MPLRLPSAAGRNRLRRRPLPCPSPRPPAFWAGCLQPKSCSWPVL